MIHQGTTVIIDEQHQLFGGCQGLVEAIEHRSNHPDFLVSIEGSQTLYSFQAEELLIP